MKTLVTSFLGFVFAGLLASSTVAQTTARNVNPHFTSPMPSEAQAFFGQTSSSPVFLSKSNGEAPLANTLETLSYFQDTTSGNWFFYPATFDSTGPIKVRYPDGSLRDTTITMHYKGVGERFTTNLKTAYLDSASFTFYPHTFGASDHLIFFVRPMYDVPATSGGTLPVIDFFNANSPLHITKQVIYTMPLKLDTFNTISVNFGHLLLATKNHNFAIVAIPVGPGIATDSILYQMDANLNTFQNPWTVDTDQTRSYLVRADSGLQIEGNGPLGDLQQLQGGQLTGQAFFGNLIMNAYLSGVSSGVNDQAASTNRLDANNPNPVSGTTQFNFSIASSGIVSLKLFNSIGQEMATIADGFETAGTHFVKFDASKLASGVYACRMQAGNFTTTTTMIVNR